MRFGEEAEGFVDFGFLEGGEVVGFGEFRGAGGGGGCGGGGRGLAASGWLLGRGG